ncbi:MAG: hypothetical protein NUV42_02030 [Candidatus Yonathbacteria bacterium]|nr:hypothetical protein [Candidatus Yonathbacteria bacterium]
MKPHRRFSPSQYYLFHNVYSTSRARADKVVRGLALNDTKREKFTRAIQKLDESRIVVNVNLHERIFGVPMIDSLLASKRLYNLFEIAHAAHEVNPSDLRMRIMLEFKLYGGTRDLQTVLAGMSNTEHPNYGILDYRDDPIGLSALGFYGWYRFVLNNKAKGRSTFTPADSFHITPDQVFVWDDIEGVLATRVAPDKSYWFEHINRKEIPIDEYGSTPYIEAQILGGVFLENDVDMLYYPETDQFNKEFFSKLKRFEEECGIQLKPY